MTLSSTGLGPRIAEIRQRRKTINATPLRGRLCILEGAVTVNPRDAAAWRGLARVHRNLGQPLAQRFPRTVARHLTKGTAR